MSQKPHPYAEERNPTVFEIGSGVSWIVAAVFLLLMTIPSLYENIEKSIYSPLGRPLFIYVNSAGVKRPELRKFVEYYIDHADEICRKAKCVPLPMDLYKTVRQRFDDRVEGTYFYDSKGESRVGSLSEIYVEQNLTQPQ